MTALAEATQPYGHDAIAPVAADLAAARGRIETAFVDVGTSLAQSDILLSRITRTFETLPAELASSELTEATTRLSAVGYRAAEIAASFATEESDIVRLVGVVSAAKHPISDLRRSIKMMGIVAINARVVAAGIVGNQNDFDIFTTDIAVLLADASKTIAAFYAVYGQLAAEVHRAADQRRQFEATHRDTLCDLSRRLDINIGEIVSRRAASAQGSAETGRVSRNITERVGIAVMAMQVGDSTSQRIEHIEAALSGLAGTSGRTRILRDIASLEAAQLAGAAEHFDAEVAEAEMSLRQLAADALSVMSRSRDIYGEAGTGGGSSLAVFRAEVHRAVAVLQSCEAERRKLEEVSRAVEDTVKILLDHVSAVRNIEANMRLVSLNAAIRCAKLGESGRALNVIARQLRELTGETVEAAECAMRSLEQTASLAHSFSVSSSGEAAGQVAWLEQEAVSAVFILETVDRRLSEALAVLNADGPAAVRHLGEAAAHLADHAEISEVMADAIVSLMAISGNGSVRDAAPESLTWMSDLFKTYTMEAERQTHRAFAPKDGKLEINDSQPEAGLDDMLF